ncbi:MAG TPA: hypothetical protein PK156_04665 [Polyangium sp.]|nr:hypothetical protein [Polyangium sp.]
MKNLSRSLAIPLVAVALFVFACGKPKQSEVPDAEKETAGPDMANDDTSGNIADDKAGAGKEDMRAKCCASCKEGLAADRSGAAPDTIPCADFTANLSVVCLEYFRATPTKASECK